MPKPNFKLSDKSYKDTFVMSPEDRPLYIVETLGKRSTSIFRADRTLVARLNHHSIVYKGEEQSISVMFRKKSWMSS